MEPTLTPSNVPTDVPEADDLAQTMEAQWKEVESALRQSKQRMIAGEEGSPTEFEIGEEAWLDAKNVNSNTEPQTNGTTIGTLQSDRKSPTGPTRDKKRTFENRLPPITIDGEEEYEVEGITDAEERNGKWFFWVKWKGYGSEENTWEPRENLKNAEKI
ncbi:Chromo (CHRromatin Organization MOdifier) domain [Rhizoctonia solani]|uniref:Chromo (CHRromatin Organization MOdifier) domain n=1 Tax=Rhizoctonia solani TaxID=456999 RepID=A0A8H7I325_9AGAM|nr:Chromo (CHRromatin Organization MOdifier) domain [Rhizoctonia solani]